MPTFLIAGILASFFALVLELLLGSVSGFEYPAMLTPLPLALFAIIEESVKLTVLFRTAAFRRETSIFPACTTAFAAGFGGTELLLAISMFPDVPNSAIAGIFAVHFMTVLLYGYAFERRFSKPLIGIVFLIGTIMHLLYNLAIA